MSTKFDPQDAFQIYTLDLESSLFAFAAREWETQLDQMKMPFDEYSLWIPLMSSLKDETAV